MTSFRLRIPILILSALFLCACTGRTGLRARPDITVPPAETAAYTETAAPDISFVDSNGNPVRLSDLFGKPIVLKFFHPDGDPEMEDLKLLQSAYDQHKDEILFITVLEQDPGMLEFPEGVRFTLPLFHDPDGSAFLRYQSKDTPAIFFIDADGFIAAESRTPISKEALDFGIKLI